jgi:hypothetical protein
VVPVSQNGEKLSSSKKALICVRIGHVWFVQSFIGNCVNVTTNKVDRNIVMNRF